MYKLTIYNYHQADMKTFYFKLKPNLETVVKYLEKFSYSIEGEQINKTAEKLISSEKPIDTLKCEDYYILEKLTFEDTNVLT